MTLGWYVHHHGRGHLNRFLAVAPELEQVTVLSSLPRPRDAAAEWIELPLDVPLSPAQQDTVQAGGLLHWAPLGESDYRRRMAMLAAWIARENPAAVVVDVSVEVALLVRLMGVKVIWVAQRGIRDDQAHRLAYGAAEMIIAPWTAATQAADQPGAPPPERVVHVGALSRFDARLRTPPPAERRVGLLLGFGGHSVRAEDVVAAAAATPDWTWEVTGINDVPDLANVISHPPECDVWALLGRAAVVVASASGNVVSEVAAAGRPLICLAQERPFAEQHQQAAALSTAGLALAPDGWPAAERWPALLASAREHGGWGWSALHDGAGARRFAEAVRTVTDACA